MFESVAPGTFESRSKRLLYETLPVSIALHAIGISAAVIIAVWNVVFPTQSPRLVRAYSLVSIPEPPPPPRGTPAAPKAVALPMDPEKIVAPNVIPDTIPQIADPPPRLTLLTPAPAPTTGVPEGDPNGVVDGQAGAKGVLGGIALPEDGRVHVERNKQLPLEVLSQDWPKYPDKGRRMGLEDQLIVRYIIGKDGRIKQIEIIDHAQQPMFDEAAVEAIKLWRFRPMIRDGSPVEVVHELGVNFVLIRH